MLKDKNIICYCSGGLGNRIKPITSCYNIAIETNRNFQIVWPETLRLQAPFSSIFSPLPEIQESSLPSLQNAEIYTPPGSPLYEKNLNNLNGLFQLSQSSPSFSLDTRAIYNSKAQNVVIFANTFLPDIPKEKHKVILQKHLHIKPEIRQAAESFPLLPDTIGVHARGTDFNVPKEYYLEQMKQFSGPFFLCSDSLEYEQFLSSQFSNVSIRQKSSYVSKACAGDWDNNVLTPTESVVESLIDLLILARTNLKVYHPRSSFAELVEYFKA
jgi:hypothetical protein